MNKEEMEAAKYVLKKAGKKISGNMLSQKFSLGAILALHKRDVIRPIINPNAFSKNGKYHQWVLVTSDPMIIARVRLELRAN